MRASPWVPALLIALLAQAALGQEAGFDPLRRDAILYLTTEGTLSPEPPAEGEVPAPASTPLAEGPAIWAYDVPQAAALAGEALVTLQVHVHAPSTAVQRPIFNVTLLKAGEPFAGTEAGAEGLTAVPASTLTLRLALPVDGVAFQAGENLALQVVYRSVSTAQAASADYLVGPDGSQVALAWRFASLDALGHSHAPADRHVPHAEHTFRMGDLGEGLWGMDLSLGDAAQAAAPFEAKVPAAATRVLLQLYRTPEFWRADLPPLDLDLPGGPTQVHAGEVVVREVPVGEGFAVVCRNCGAQPQTLAAYAVDAAALPGGEPLTPTERGGPIAVRPGAGEEDLSWLLVLFAPASLMLVGSVAYVLRDEPLHPSRPAPRAGPQAQRGQQPQRLQARGAPRRP